MKRLQEWKKALMQKTFGRGEDVWTAEKQADSTGNEYAQVASIILKGVGGKGNVVSIGNCITRLRLKVRDEAMLDEKKILSAGVAGIVRPDSASVQMIIGVKAPLVAEEFKKLCQADASE